MYSLAPSFKVLHCFIYLNLLAISICLPTLLYGQPNSNSESYLENLEENLPTDNNTLLEELQYYHQHPININSNELSPFLQLGLMTDYQIQQLNQYIERVGPLLSLYELQAVPNFDPATIERLRPFIVTSTTLDDVHLSFKEVLKESTKWVYARWQNTLETKRGFAEKKYLGDANKLYLRYFQSYGAKMSLGITAEKDSGEQFFNGANKKGFDFYSFHLFIKRLTPKIERLVIGDFSAQFGQGLILNNRYTRGKGALVTDIKRSGPSLHRFTSVAESLAFRGVGLSWNTAPHQQVTGFISYRKRDATIRLREEEAEAFNYFEAFHTSGYHRTDHEIEKKRRVGQLTTGLQFQQTFKNGSLQFNNIFNQLSLPLLPSDQAYNFHRYSGKQLWSGSMDYQYTFRNYHFFGETALSQNGTVATVNGLVSSLLPDVSLAVHWRHLPPSFHSLFGQSFAESSLNNNESGIYIGLSYQPHPHWRWDVYADYWKHPWLRFLIDAPSKGKEYFSRLTFIKRKQLEAYTQLKMEWKQRSYKVQNADEKVLLNRAKTNLRFHLRFHHSSALELRSRVEFSFFKLRSPLTFSGNIFYDQTWLPLSDSQRKGVLIYQDILYKPIGKPLSFTTRIAFFAIDNYDARIYAYENDLLNQFSIPAYYNTGNRVYLNIRYQAKKWFTLEGRVAQTYWWNQESIGSGWEKIEGPRRTEVKVQARMRF